MMRSNFPAFAGETASETKVFDARSNRIDGTRHGYDQLDQTFDSMAKDRMTELCWWRSFLNPGQCFVGYSYGYNATGAMTQVNGLKGNGTAWTQTFDYPFTNALSDVYSTVTKTTNGGGPVLVMESFSDAFGRRRAKRNALSDGQEFLYDLGHQVLVDSMWKDTASSVTADEYVWLDGRPVLAFRSNLSATGTHSIDYVDTLDTGAGNCSRPIDEGRVNCGLFHLVSNLQGFVNVAIHDGTGLVASVMLPDADGTVNQPRMMSAGTNGTAWTQRFNVPASFSKQARFRTAWTGGIPGWGGVTSFQLNGQTVLTPNGGELGQVWSSWGPTVTGTTDVVWSTTCSGGCMSAADQFEWRAWEGGAARFQTRLRFPGQYADAETDFYENWNRYYDPPTGRYWSPEPEAAGAGWLEDQTTEAVASPTYSYAASNPVHYKDEDGRQVARGNPVAQGGLLLTGYLLWQMIFNPPKFPPPPPPPGPTDSCESQPAPPPTATLAKGGKKNIDNEYVRRARQNRTPVRSSERRTQRHERLVTVRRLRRSRRPRRRSAVVRVAGADREPASSKTFRRSRCHGDRPRPAQKRTQRPCVRERVPAAGANGEGGTRPCSEDRPL